MGQMARTHLRAHGPQRPFIFAALLVVRWLRGFLLQGGQHKGLVNKMASAPFYAI